MLIDGRILHEPYVHPNSTTDNFGPTKIAKNHYWVMGDNRTNSKDSRVFGSIARSLIVGRAFIRVWPLSGITLL